MKILWKLDMIKLKMRCFDECGLVWCGCAGPCEPAGLWDSEWRVNKAAAGRVEGAGAQPLRPATTTNLLTHK